MRISDWSSDVCSSDLAAAPAAVGETILSGKGFIPSPAKWWGPAVLEAECGRTSYWAIREPAPLPSRLAPDGCGRAPFFSFSYTLRTVAEELSRDHKPRGRQGLTCPAKAIKIGQATWRERGSQYVSISVGAVSIKKKIEKKKL